MEDREVRETREGRQEHQPGRGERVAGWLTETVVRSLVALLGVALLLFALGQLVGVDLLEIVGGFLTSSVGTWLVVAAFALILILAASRSWSTNWY